MQRADAFIKLQERIEKGRQLKNREATSADEYLALKAERAKWSDYNHELLKQMFTTDEAAKEYSFFGFGTGAINASWQTRLDELREGIDESVHRLESIQERLEIIPAVAGLECAPVAVSSQIKTVNSASPTRAFIVHGHDEAAKEKVARMLEKQKITAIILHEQASLGESIVEKLERYSDVAFAIVLLTPDDEGRAKKGAAVDLRPRARQNVILELGYFTRAWADKTFVP